MGVALQPIMGRLAERARARQRVLQVQALAEPLYTRGSEERLERVLGHLVDNALDATPAEGRVWLGAERHKSQVHITVGDTGSGMTADFIAHRLFKPFDSTKPEGMGIGMHESRSYVQELGGEIEVDSEVGRGTVFRVTLPLLDAADPLRPVQLAA